MSFENEKVDNTDKVQILNNNPIPDQAITKLPTELQEMIWGKIDPADRAMLALTSKSHAAMYQELKDVKVRRNGKMVRRLPRPLRIDKVLRLKTLVRLKEWMPKTHRLCYSCGMYLDIKKVSKTGGLWGGDNLLVMTGLATKKAMNEGPCCPICNRRATIEMTKHKNIWEQYAELGRSVTLK